MSSLNKAMLIGNLGADPEVRYTKSGQAVADLRVATNETWYDRDRNRQERTEWHRVVAWGQQAEFAQNYLHKGNKVYVEGRIQTREWTDQQNTKRYTTEVVAQVLRGLDRPSDGAGGGAARQGGARSGQGGPPPADAGYNQAPPSDPQGPPGPDEAYMEDDIPF